MRVLVVTVVHHPYDARILHREIAALVAAGHDVAYAAPFTAYGVAPPAPLRTFDLPRARGRNRLRAQRAARRLLHREAPAFDVVLLHDPELLVAARGIRRPPIVWDVHEDTAAAMSMKPWLPGWLRSPAARAVTAAERRAERHHPLLLAEEGYRDRFVQQHPVVPNSTAVPAQVPKPGADRVIYVGHLSLARGAAELAALGRPLRERGIELHLVGHADTAATAAISAATAAGDLVWHGFLPNDQALALVEGSLAGLSLLHDEPNYRHSRPTKVIEYMAHGVPVITTPTPPAVELVDGCRCGVVVPFGDVAAALQAVLDLRDDPAQRLDFARRGHSAALANHDWATAGPDFVAELEAIAQPCSHH